MNFGVSKAFKSFMFESMTRYSGKKVLLLSRISYHVISSES